MNRRSFVQTLGAGALGAFSVRANVLALPASAPTSLLQASAATPVRLIRIGGNENPYGPGPAAIEAAKNVTDIANRYPGPWTQRLIDAIAAKFDVPTDHVLLSGGSGDILRAAVNAFTSRSSTLVTASPSYEAPMRQAQQIGSPIRAVPLTADMRLNIAAMARGSASSTGLVYICNPNNPSSTAVPGRDIADLIVRVARGTTYVLVDEAYFEYADLAGFETIVPHAVQNPNVIVARTLSKIHGMAGMRVGYAIAQPKTLAALREEHSGSGLSVMSLAAATASLADTAHIEQQAALNRDVRKNVIEGFTAAGYDIAASDANFVFVNIRRDSRGFQDAMLAKGVAVGRAFPPLNNWSRITIGTAEEMARAMPIFMDVLAMPPVPASALIDHRAFPADGVC